MNSIIQKCITELDSAEPKLDYVKGLLEAALMMSGGQSIQTTPYQPPYVVTANSTPAVRTTKEIPATKEEVDLVTEYEKGKIGAINT